MLTALPATGAAGAVADGGCPPERLAIGGIALMPGIPGVVR